MDFGMLLFFDIDNVIANTDPVIRNIIREHTNGRIDLSQEDVVEFNYCSCPTKTGQLLSKSEWDEVLSIFSTPKVLNSIEVFPGVQNYLDRLSKRYKIQLATSRSPETKEATIAWMQENRLDGYEVHFLDHGKKHEALRAADVIVEDYYEQAASFAQNGTRCFVFRYPWNAEKPPLPSIEWVEGWDELMDKLLP